MNNEIFSTMQIKTKNFKIIDKKQFNSTNNTMYQIASCSKFITSIVVGKLYELGQLDYDTDINKYLKRWKCPAKNITLRTLLNHTSGTNDGLGYLGYEPFTLKKDLPTNIETINGEKSYKGVNFVEKPGKIEMYSGAGYQVIQQVLEEITGKHLYQLMNQYIFRPLKLTNSTGKILYPGKHKYKLSNMNNCYRLYPETAAAGIWMSSNDLLKMSMDLCKSYKYDTGKLLKQETLMLFSNQNIGTYDIIKNKLIFGHSGQNYGYKAGISCYPMEGKCTIVLINYNPCCKNGLNKAKKIINNYA